MFDMECIIDIGECEDSYAGIIRLHEDVAIRARSYEHMKILQ